MTTDKHSRLGGIQKRILAITISCLLGMCVIISSVSFYIFRNYLQHSLIHATETNLQLLSDSINSDMDHIYQLIRFCQNSPDIANYIANNPDPGSVLSVTTYDRMAEEHGNNPAKTYIPRLAVITGQHFLQVVNAVYSSTANLSEEVPALPFFSELLESSGISFSAGFIRDPFYKNGKNVLLVIRPITYPYSSVQGGYLLLEISSELFTHALERYGIAEDSRVYLSIDGHHYLYENKVITEILPDYHVTEDLSSTAMIADSQVNRIADREGESRIVVTAPLNMPNCHISQSISRLELQNQQLLLLCILGGTLIGILAIGILLMFTLNRMIAVPVYRIRRKTLRVAQGDFSRDPSIEWNHELGDIGKSINDLAENVFLLMQSRVESEKQKKDLEYKMLQSQVNPHFLYNTLNSIKWMASIQGASGIAEMTTSLAKLLKSISKGTSLRVPLREELSLLQDYFTIQSYRYGGTVTMDIHVEPETLLDCQILKFTLQPLVENAIFHGIEPKGSGHIRICAAQEELPAPASGSVVLPGPASPAELPAPALRGIRIDVTDDGVGMSPEKAADILHSNKDSATDFFREIGVSNVHRRLQYEFGEEYGITIDSVEGRYTTMSIHIPALYIKKDTSSPDDEKNDRSENEHVQTIGRR